MMFNVRNGPLSGLWKNQTVYYNKRYMDHIESFYHVSMVFLFEKLFLTDCYNHCSVEQERLARAYLDAAGEVTDNMTNKEPNPYEYMLPELLDLDKFLGGFHGSFDDRYMW